MIYYWFTPIVSRSPLSLGKDRFLADSSQELEHFRTLLNDLHPWLLPMFKSSLLLSDDESCGSIERQLELDSEDTLVFDGEIVVISHCAEAFFDRIMSPAEAKKRLLAALDHFEPGTIQQTWCRCLMEWTDNGWEFILLREDSV